MPQLQNLVLTDRSATPVAYTFTPRNIVNGVAIVANSDGTLEADKLFTISSRRSAGKYKVREQLRIPVVQTEVINGISKPKVIREAVIDVTYTFALSSTEAERNNAVGMFQDAQSTTKVLVHDTVVKGQGVFGA